MSVAEQVGLSQTWSGTSKTGYLMTGTIYDLNIFYHRFMVAFSLVESYFLKINMDYKLDSIEMEFALIDPYIC